MGPEKWVGEDLTTGAVFVTQTVQYLKGLAGGSFLDFFLLFQSFGMVGIAFLIRSVLEVSTDLQERVTLPLIGLFFLPGLHFWTAAIGKDAPLFMGAAMCIWAMIRIEKRFPAFLLALAIMVAFRPHIAAISTLALLLTLVFDARLKARFKLPILAIAGGALVAVATTVSASLKVSLFSPESIADFLASKQEYGMSSTLGEGMGDLPFILKVPSLLFRPFFFDATGAMGFIVSFENVAILIIFGSLIWRLPALIRLSASVPYIRYCLIYSIILITTLSIVTYNVGLGLRQKYMVMPAIMLLYATVILYRRSLLSSSTHQHNVIPSAVGLMHPTEQSR
ncbi:hypothetical protein [Sphingosinicella rhizophila]|nr:hypothetical protein [Sphingosinicella sp. GR2756]